MSILKLGTPGGVGVSLATPLQQPQDNFSGEFGDRKGTRTFVIAYSAASDAWTALLPDTGDAHPSFPSLEFKDFTLKQDAKEPGRATLVLKYEEEDFTTGGGGTLPDLPDDEYVENGSNLEIDLVRHPKFSTTNPAWTNSTGDALSLSDYYNPREQRIFVNEEIPEQFIDEDGQTKTNVNAGETVPEEIRGMSKFVVGTGTVTETVYSYNEPATVIQNAGKRKTPTGYPDPSTTNQNWLVLSSIKQKEGGFWQVVTVYQFSSRVISDWVYDVLV